MSKQRDESAPARRPSYGPHSPKVGRRGVETRRRLLDHALVAFGRDGYWGMSIEDLCRRAGVSRATFYQYFEGKSELFENLASDTGGDILRLSDRLEPLGPSPDGVVNLHAWLHEFQHVYERHAPVFELWSEAIFDSPRLRAMGETFLERYTDALTPALCAAGVDRSYAARLALAIMGTAERLSLMGSRSSSSETEQAFAALAVTVQLMLCPETSDEALRRAVSAVLPTV